MKVKHILVITSLFFVVFICNQPVSQAQSLWSNSESGRAINLFADRRAHDIGDIVTIKIDESSSTSTTKAMSNGKSGSNSLGAGVGIFHFLAAASANQSDTFTANGSAKDTNSVSGTITVTVIDMQPNGNMIVQGTQSIWQNKNEHRITFRGIIRPDDIANDNTISSNLVADATLTFDGKGPLNAKQRQGILTQILNVLF
ncbi:flagellar basal body L-ring protein FlgH [Pectinatus brassicae]|uniref:Flagellar L-ring protein n=1 Tax=Pectinatus brassicae TaxID=862415 RepID=A0A840UU82_9FIRM|nr:flagellar basal body L-ring protein FlgH [Pectinatus brassicae]MBB5336374.1 flagellar L-ring protein precursor FlgH [Pectinatus brassicae]